MRSILALALVGASSLARAEPQLIRFATIAPDGTTWARELKAWAQDVERESGGSVKLKLYFDAIAGDEPEMGERIRRGQLDGMIGSMYCYRVSSAMRVSLVVGLFQDRDEASWVMNRLRPAIDKEFLQHGFVNLGESGLGSMILFSRRPVRSMAELRQTPLLVWTADGIVPRQLEALGLHVFAPPIDDGMRSYVAGRTDAFFAAPAAALAYQWSTEARYFSDLRISFLVGCAMIANRTFDALPLEAQQAIRLASAKLSKRFEDVARQEDDALIGKLFAKQGLVRVPVDERFRTDFFEASRAARDRIDPTLISPELVRQVLLLLADYRGVHR